MAFKAIETQLRTPTYRRDRCQNWSSGILDLMK